MARRSGGTNKGVEEKRRSLPIYEHYTLSPGKTKSHHPEAKCNHCHKEFVCGSKQRLIRHLRKCNNISNPEQIIAETLNTLARNSATGQLNHSILEASNLLPSQIQQHSQHQHHHQIIGQLTHSSPNSSTTTISTPNSIINNCSNNHNNIISNHNTSGSSNNDTTNNGLSTQQQQQQQQQQLINAMSIPVKRPLKRGRKPTSQSLASSSPTIHVTTGLDGKTHFTPASQLTQNISGTINSPIIAGPIHGIGRAGVSSYGSYPGANVITTTGGAIVSTNSLTPANHHHPLSGHLTPTNHLHHSTPNYKFNSDLSDKAYLKLVLTRNLPLSLCDTKEFQLWVKTFANDYKPPNSIDLIGQNLKNDAQAAKQRISNILVKAFKKTINLEVHSWLDDYQQSSGRHLWYAVIANIDHKRFLVSLKDVKYHKNNHTVVPTNEQQPQSTTLSTTTTTTTDRLLSDFIDECVKKVGSDRINCCLVYSEQDYQFGAKVSRILYTTHPSIITYKCWWHFTNLLCSDIIELNLSFQDVIRKSNRLIHFVTRRPNLSSNLERFNPFVGFVSNVIAKKNDQRWYSHLVCYLLEYIKNNNEAIIKALQDNDEQATNQSHHQSIPSDNNNNSSGTQQNATGTQPQSQQLLSCHEDSQFNSIKTLVMSNDYWNNLNLTLAYLKPIHDIVALTSSIVSNNGNNTPQSSPVVAGNIYLSQYMSWFLNYGKTLFDSWRQSANSYKYQLIKQYLDRFASSQQNFKLLFAAYLLDPKHRCAFMTQHAKDTAIEEILNIASEFMPEESDGHTIFDQWKLYLVRDEPYDVVYEKTRTSPLDWWMSLPCAESIRRVALRILRLKAFASPKPETLFSQLYFYEHETNSNLNISTYEDVAVLRYFYDFEDKIGQQTSNNYNSYHNSTTSTNTANINSSTNHHVFSNYQDRAQVGHLHNNHFDETNFSLKYLPSGPISQNNNNCSNSNNTSGSEVDCGQGLNSSTTSTLEIDNGQNTSYTSEASSYPDVIVESYLDNIQTNHHYHTLMSSQQSGVDGTNHTNLLIEDLSSYKLFMQYVDYNIMGVRQVEEPIEKKKRKWTAQEILSKSHSNHQNNNNNNINNC